MLNSISILNPSCETLAATLAELHQQANAGARTRTVDLLTGADAFGTESQGWNARDGGGVANSYRYRAETSVLGYAWVRDEAGNLHVRCVGGRVDAPKSAYGRRGVTVFCNDRDAETVSAWELVYPDLLVNRTKVHQKGMKGEQKALYAAILANPADAGARGIYADWLQEQGGDPREIARHRQALAVIERFQSQLQAVTV